MRTTSTKNKQSAGGAVRRHDESYKPKNRIRVVTATSLFDGHDVAINIFRRILQETGAEVVHLGHNRSVDDIVRAAIEEDVQGIAVSCYQGGHVEFFKYLVDLLKEQDATHIKVFGGGGGVIISDEVCDLEAYGVAKIYTPEHGAQWGLQGILNNLLGCIDRPISNASDTDINGLTPEKRGTIARLITMAETGRTRKDSGA